MTIRPIICLLFIRYRKVLGPTEFGRNVPVADFETAPVFGHVSRTVPKKSDMNPCL